MIYQNHFESQFLPFLLLIPFYFELLFVKLYFLKFSFFINVINDYEISPEIKLNTNLKIQNFLEII